MHDPLGWVDPLGLDECPGTEGPKAQGPKKDPRQPDPVPEGIIYRRTNPETGEIYVGQAKYQARFEARQKEHDVKEGVMHQYDVIGRTEPGTDLDVLEESEIRRHGDIKETSKGTQKGGVLQNKRHQMSNKRYKKFGGLVPLPY